MAQLTMPPIDWGGDEPQSQMAVVPAAQMVLEAPHYSYTATVLTSPTFDQLVTEKAVGYPF